MYINNPMFFSASNDVSGDANEKAKRFKLTDRLTTLIVESAYAD